MAEDMELGRWPAFHMNFESKEARESAFEAWLVENTERIARQRALFEALPGVRKRNKLMRGMIDRARELLDDGYPGAADQLLEFVPETEAERFLRDYFGEDEPQEAKTDDDETHAD